MVFGQEGALRPPFSHTTVCTVPCTAVPAVPCIGDVSHCRPISAQPFLSDSVRHFRLSGPLASHLLRTGRDFVSGFRTGSALCRVVIPTHTASGDFPPKSPVGHLSPLVGAGQGAARLPCAHKRKRAPRFRAPVKRADLPSTGSSEFPFLCPPDQLWHNVLLKQPGVPGVAFRWQ